MAGGVRSTRAPANPWVANSVAASRMRRRMPSGSRCHFKTRFVETCFVLAKLVRLVMVWKRM
jgi:hypothetical protein